MATAEVNINLTMLRLEDDAINQFSNLIYTHKSEIIILFRELHDLLDTKQTSLFNELDNLLILIQTQDDQLRPLRKARVLVQTEITHNKLNTVLESTLKQLQNSINKLENESFDIPTVDIKWDTSNYSTVIDNICKVEIGKLSFSDRTQPIWSTVSKGKGPNQLYSPCGLAVDQDSGNIYVTDRFAKRIQIYNSIGEYVRTINTENYEPSLILLDTEYCYVDSMLASTMLKINKLSGNIVNRVEIYNISGMCFDVLDSNIIFMCVYYSNIVLVYNKTDLVQTNMIYLNKQYNRLTTPRDIKLLPTEMIILFTDTDYPLQCFNRKGILLRSIISKQQINYAFNFCIDKYNYYIISDRSANNIKIFIRSGKLITIIGMKGQDIGQFDCLRGICLDSNNRIIICDEKVMYKLQAF